MATTSIALSSLGVQVAASPDLPDSPALTIGYGWPSQPTLMKVATGQVGPLASVYDNGVARNTTRWPKVVGIPDTTTSPGLEATLSVGAQVQGDTATITLSGTPKTNDCVALGAFEQPLASQAVSYTALEGDTLDTIATALAAAINSGMTLVTAVAAGAVVTLTMVAAAVTMNVGVANQGTRTSEYKRIKRHVRVVLWTQSEEQRESYGDPIDVWLAKLYERFGYTTPQGDWIRLEYDADAYVEQEQVRDLYRRDFYVWLEYGVLGTDTIYPVLEGQATLGQLPT